MVIINIYYILNISFKFTDSEQKLTISAYNLQHLFVRILRISTHYRGVLRGPIYLHDEPCVENGSA